MATIRLAHFSDIHLTTHPLGWTWADWFNKRFPGWVNLKVSGRGRRFSRADAVLQALVEELVERRMDHVIFSGDSSALGFERETAHAAEILGLTNGRHLPGLAVPGNHDYYNRAAAASGSFERYFAPWQQGRRVRETTYPFVQKVGHVWLIAVNSCSGNRWFWDAAGSVAPAELQRLEGLLAELEPGPRILVTHYPLCLANGDPERWDRRLRNAQELLAVANRGGINLWLHGHRHHWYHVARPPGARFPIICAGSGTQSGRWSYGEYTIEGDRLHALRRSFDPQTGKFTDRESFELELSHDA